MQDGVENQLMDLMAKARRAGADAVEVRAGRVEATSVAVRHGRLETVERQESERWDLKVWIGSRSAALSTADLGDFTSRADCVDQALAVARLAPEDPHALLPPSGLVRSTLSDRAETALDLYDPREAAAGDLEALA